MLVDPEAGLLLFYAVKAVARRLRSVEGRLKLRLSSSLVSSSCSCSSCSSTSTLRSGESKELQDQGREV